MKVIVSSTSSEGASEFPYTSFPKVICLFVVDLTMLFVPPTVQCTTGGTNEVELPDAVAARSKS